MHVYVWSSQEQNNALNFQNCFGRKMRHIQETHKAILKSKLDCKIVMKIFAINYNILWNYVKSIV